MTKLLIIADDFTGAMDTGVKFVNQGATTKIIHTIQEMTGECIQTCDVLVINTESRHMQPMQAYEQVYCIAAEAKRQGIPYLYKKTDSALRGNIGSELQAVLDATGCTEVTFIPAYPAMERITSNGVHYINKCPLADTVFAQDPTEPVLCSYIPDIIKLQSDVPVLVRNAASFFPKPVEPSIVLYDAETQRDVETIASRLMKENRLYVMAGCAGFASILPDVLEMKNPVSVEKLQGERLMVFCGSVNPITKQQLEFAQPYGVHRIQLTPQRILSEEGSEEEYRIACEARRIYEMGMTLAIETLPSFSDDVACSSEDGLRIADAIGRIATQLIQWHCDGVYMFTGGDTLRSFLTCIDGHEIGLMQEIAPGVVLSQIQTAYGTLKVISKSGGFGKPDLLVTILHQL